MREAAAKAMAFGVADKVALPFRARTLTRPELRRNERRFVVILFAIFAGFILFILTGLILDGGQANRQVLRVFAPIALVCTILVALICRWRLRKFADYQDPVVEVEVDEGGVTIRWNRQDYLLTYDAVSYQIYYQAQRRNFQFLGVQLESPIGPLYINDQWYLGGRKAAAVIIAEHDKWRALRRLAEP